MTVYEVALKSCWCCVATVNELKGIVLRNVAPWPQQVRTDKSQCNPGSSIRSHLSPGWLQAHTAPELAAWVPWRSHVQCYFAFLNLCQTMGCCTSPPQASDAKNTTLCLSYWGHTSQVWRTDCKAANTTLWMQIAWDRKCKQAAQPAQL